MKLELKHIAPYLPYAVKFYRPYLIHTGGENPQPDHDEWGEDEVTLENAQRVIDSGLPLILYPLSNIDNAYIDNSPYVNQSRLIDEAHNDRLPTNVFNSLVKDHFDVFGLIDAGLAIDINTL